MMLRKLLTTLTKKFGFDCFAYLYVKASEYRTVSNYPPEWQDLYQCRNYLQIDPVVRLAQAKTKPFSWTQEQFHTASLETRQFFSAAADFNICSGISLPVHAGFGSMAMLTLATTSRQIILGKHIDPALAASSVGQIHAYFSYHPDTSMAHLISLNPNQLICLKWASEGKTAKDIAILADMKYSNVRFHLREALKKLDALSLQQATAKATRLRLI